jgi:hypothetical protein
MRSSQPISNSTQGPSGVNDARSNITFSTTGGPYCQSTNVSRRGSAEPGASPFIGVGVYLMPAIVIPRPFVNTVMGGRLLA